MYQTETSASKPQTVLWLLWSMLVSTLGVLGGVGLFLRETDILTLTSPLTAEDLAILTPIFGSLAVAITVAIFAGGPVLAKHTNYQAYCLIRWALAEAIGMIGFVLFVLGASWNVLATFLGWALVLAFYLRPSEDGHAHYQQLAGKDEANWRLRTSHA